MNNKDFADLCARAWSLPVLAFLAGTAGARVSPTAHALGAGRRVTSATYAHLLAIGLVERMPGHGHPLRPEYRLRTDAELIAAWAKTFWAGLQPAERDLARRAWVLPVLRLLGEPRGFGQLRTSLTPVTDRALALCLRRLVESDLTRRDVDATQRPPRVTYAASEGRGQELVGKLALTLAVETDTR